MIKYDGYKDEVLNCARWLSENGFFGGHLGSKGNVSRIDRKDNRIVITPSDRPYQSMSVEDICVIDSDLKPVESVLAPSIEAGMHIGIYRHRPDVNAVVHTHQVFASVLSLLNQPIPALFDEITYEIGPEVEIIPYAVSGSRQLVENVISKLNNGCLCYIIQNHGALSLGESLQQAMKNAELLEKTAQVYCYALSTGHEISRLPESAVQQVLDMRKSK